MRKRPFLNSLMLLMVSAPLCKPQTSDVALNDGFTPGAMMPGSPAGSYALSGFDTVNLSNGYLNITLPLFAISERGGRKITLSPQLSPTWTAYQFEYTVGNSCNQYGCSYATGYSAGYGGGGIVSLGGMSLRSSGDYCTGVVGTSPESTGSWQNVLTRATFYAPNGTETDFVDQNSGGAPQPGSAGYSRGTLFNATDGSFAKFTSSTSINDPISSGSGCFSSDSGATGTLQFRDGTTYTFSNGAVTQIRDRNGNLTSAAANSGTYVITDSLGREYTDILNSFDNNSQRYYDQIQYKGGSGVQRTITIWYETLDQAGMLAPGESIQSYGQLWPVLTNQDPSAWNFQENFTAPVISEIDLPDGTEYRFTYHSYGDVAQIVLPTLAAVQYDYTAVTDTTATPPLLQRVLTERREYLRAGDSTPSAVTKYSLSGNSATVDHLDGSGNRLAMQVYTVLNTGSLPPNYAATGTGYNSWQYNLPSQVNSYDKDGSTLLESQTTTWAQQNCSSCWFGNPQSSSAPSYNPTVQTVATTMNNVTQQTAYYYDQYNDVTDTFVSDWAPTGGVLQHTQTAYGYSTPTILPLPTETKVLDGAGNVYTDTTYGYDAAGIVPYSNINGTYHDNGNFNSNQPRGNLTSVRQCLNAPNCTWLTSSFQYDIAGNLVSQTDANGHGSSFSYNDNYADGQNRSTYAFVTAAWNALGQVPFQGQYDYNTGNLTLAADLNGQYTSYGYNDPLERLTQVHLPNGGNINCNYPSPTQVVTRQDQNTAGDGALVSEKQYDGFGRQIESDLFETASQYIATTWNYDALGRVQTATNPSRYTSGQGDGLGYTTTYAYDGLGRATQVTLQDGSIAATSYFGNQATATDQAGHVRQTVTDGLGRLSQVVEDPGGLKYHTTYTYGANDTLQFVTQGTQAPRTFYYDSLARLVAAANLENTVWYGYDNVGNLTSRTDGRNITTTYGYDVLNRVTSKSYNGGSTYNVTYTYGTGNPANSMGHLTQVNNGWSITNYTAFDPVGNVKASNQQTASQTYSFAYLYNLAGSLTSETYPSGRVVTTTYDGANRAYSVAGVLNGQSSNYVTQMGYVPHGAPNWWWYGNGVYPVATYNARLQPSQIYATVNNNGNQFLSVLSYSWGGTNNNGSLQTLWEMYGASVPYSSLATFTQSFSYDTVNRLTGVNDSGGYSRSFGYDQWGNMWVLPGYTGLSPAGPTSNVYNGSNQMNGTSYDAAGNQLSVNGDTLAYDAENRQIQATEPPSLGGATESYYYDGNGQRVQKTGPAGTTIYVYDAFGQLAAEYATDPGASPCTTCYLSYDHLGSVRLVTDQNANVVSRHDYLPFGEELPGGTAGRNGQWGAFDNTSQRFTGQIRDAETGEDCFNARYFTGALGRFNSADPGNAGADLANPQSWNGYAYVSNNPLNGTDPSGACLIVSFGVGDSQGQYDSTLPATASVYPFSDLGKLGGVASVLSQGYLGANQSTQALASAISQYQNSPDGIQLALFSGSAQTFVTGVNSGTIDTSNITSVTYLSPGLAPGQGLASVGNTTAFRGSGVVDFAVTLPARLNSNGISIQRLGSGTGHNFLNEYNSAAVRSALAGSIPCGVPPKKPTTPTVPPPPNIPGGGGGGGYGPMPIYGGGGIPGILWDILFPPPRRDIEM